MQPPLLSGNGRRPQPGSYNYDDKTLRGLKLKYNVIGRPDLALRPPGKNKAPRNGGLFGPSEQGSWHPGAARQWPTRAKRGLFLGAACGARETLPALAAHVPELHFRILRSHFRLPGISLPNYGVLLLKSEGRASAR